MVAKAPLRYVHVVFAGDVAVTRCLNEILTQPMSPPPQGEEGGDRVVVVVNLPEDLPAFGEPSP